MSSERPVGPADVVPEGDDGTPEPDTGEKAETVADEDGQFRYRYSRAAAQAAFELMGTPEGGLKDVLCPTMLIHADHSRLLTDADVDRATDELRRVRVETVPGGHAVLWDAFAETGAHVRSFLVARKTA